MREKIVFTDGKKVTVTPYSLRVGKRLYPFEDITKYGLTRIRPNRLPALALMLTGAAVAAVEYFKVVPPNVYYWVPQSVTISDFTFSQSDIVTGAGILLFAFGLIAFVAMPTRYAVRVVNAVGDINAVTTRRKKYAQQIVDAIGIGIRSKQIEPRREERVRTVRKEIV